MGRWVHQFELTHMEKDKMGLAPKIINLLIKSSWYEISQMEITKFNMNTKSKCNWIETLRTSRNPKYIEFTKI